MEELLKRKNELEKELSKFFVYPLNYIQVIKKERLEKELNKVNCQIKIIKLKESKWEVTTFRKWENI